MNFGLMSHAKVDIFISKIMKLLLGIEPTVPELKVYRVTTRPLYRSNSGATSSVKLYSCSIWQAGHVCKFLLV